MAGGRRRGCNAGNIIPAQSLPYGATGKTPSHRYAALPGWAFVDGPTTNRTAFLNQLDTEQKRCTASKQPGRAF
ncbi:hypothetical protein MASR2M8_16360 [Opitutaceae bacterium]